MLPHPHIEARDNSNGGLSSDLFRTSPQTTAHQTFAWTTSHKPDSRLPHVAMRLKRHVSLLESSLKHVSPRPLISSQCNRYRYASSASHPEQIAILGGGISGLASAHFISKEFPKSKITVFESGEEAGGWIKSRRIDVKGRSVLFEYGPRTLRPGPQALATAQLVCSFRVRSFAGSNMDRSQT